MRSLICHQGREPLLLSVDGVTLAVVQERRERVNISESKKNDIIGFQVITCHTFLAGRDCAGLSLVSDK